MRQVLLWLAVGMLGAASPAAADNLTLFNCSEEPITFKLYNEGDIFCAIPKHTFTLNKCGLSMQSGCEGLCKVDPLGSGCNFAKLNGQWVVKKGSQYIGGIQYFQSGQTGSACALCGG
jgi:hypothetical protein